MRLSPQQVSAIREAAERAYGAGCRLWLFGSRTDDALKGGDIDLYLEPELSDPDALVDAKLRFMVELHRRLGERKIDVVVRRPGAGPDLAIYERARKEGIRLS